MRLIDKDRLLKAIDGYEQVCRDTDIKPTLYGIESLIYDAPTVDLWHYPSKGEYPPLLEYVFCKLADNTYEVGYYQGQIAGEPEWAFTCFLDDVVAWQYIIPPKEEA